MPYKQAEGAKKPEEKRRKRKRAGVRKIKEVSSRLGLYIISLSLLFLAANYVLAYEWAWMEAIMGRFLPPDMPRPSSELWRPLALLVPAATCFLGYLVYARGNRIADLTGKRVRDAYGLAGRDYSFLGSMLKYHAGLAPDKVSADRLHGDLRRMRCVALLHGMFSEHGGARVSASDYLRQVSRETVKGISPDFTRLSLDLAPIQLEHDTALACGLIVSELVSNCLRSAFVEVDRPKISVYFGMIGKNMAELRVTDNGIGIPTRMDVDKLATLGLKVVKKQASQLKGKVDISVSNGTTVRVRFPL